MDRFDKDGLIHLAGVDPESVVDGPGLRGVVFFQGCIHHCPGCHNPETWSLEGGALKTPAQVWQMLHYNPLLAGITISGGEPLLQPGAALILAQKTREAGGNVVIYTGFRWEEILKTGSGTIKDLLELTWLLVDGPYMEREKAPELKFRGSRNQRIIDVHASCEKREAVLWQEKKWGVMDHRLDGTGS